MADEAPEQQRMEEHTKEANKFQAFSPEQVEEWLKEKGFGKPEYERKFIEQDINGKNFLLLDNTDLKEIGISSLGDRLAIRRELKTLQNEERRRVRLQMIAEETEAYNGTCFGENIATCCGIFPRDPAKYVLYPTKLKIKSYEVYRLCGTIKCICCGGEWSTDNIALDKIRDIDAKDTYSGVACFREDKMTIVVAVQAGVAAADESEQARIQDHSMFINNVKDPDGHSNAFFSQIQNQKAEYLRLKDTDKI